MAATQIFLKLVDLLKAQTVESLHKASIYTTLGLLLTLMIVWSPTSGFIGNPAEHSVTLSSGDSFWPQAEASLGMRCCCHLWGSWGGGQLVGGVEICSRSVLYLYVDQLLT